MSEITNPKEFLWSQKYRPSTVEDCILPEGIKKTLTSIVSSGRIPNLLLSGPRGGGKTTAALAMCDELSANKLFLNASEDSGIDVIRTTIRQFASSYSITGTGKVVILDEADGLSPTAQGALKSFIEEFSKSCTFIFTCNNPNKIIEPIHSRCATIEFIIPQTERAKLASNFFKRMTKILEQENIEYNKTVVATVVNRYFPDFRKVVNELQKFSLSGTIDVGVLSELDDTKFKELVDAMSKRNFPEVRKWVSSNTEFTTDVLLRKIYDEVIDLIDPNTIGEAVMIIANYMYKDAFVVDKEVNRVAALTELMMSCNWK